MRAPATFDWAAAAEIVRRRASRWLQAYRADDVVVNLDEITAATPTGDDGRARWRRFVAEDPIARAELAALRSVRRLAADRARAWDPRLDEIAHIAAACERLWRERLGDEAFAAWIDRASDRGPRPPLAVAVSQPFAEGHTRSRAVDDMQPADGLARWPTAARLAWRRVAEVARSTTGQVDKLAAAARRSDRGRQHAFETLRARLEDLAAGAEALVATAYL